MKSNRLACQPPLRRRPLAAGLAALLFAQAGAIVAATPAANAPTGALPVLNCNDSGAGSLRAAIAGAASGDIIDLSGLACTTITLTSGELAVGVADLSLRGPASAGMPLTISGNNLSRVFAQGGSGTLRLSDLSLVDGKAPEQGGCILASGNLELDRVVVSDCAAGTPEITGSRGGAIAVSGNAVLAGSELRDNRVDGQGLVRGGAIAVAGTLRATGSRFTGNTAYSHQVSGGSAFQNEVEGGAIQVMGATSLVGSVVSGNLAFSDSYQVFGGGIAVGGRGSGATPGSLTLTGSDVIDNTADSDCGVCAPQGGGIWLNGNATFNRATIRDNSVGSLGHYGGGGGVRFTGSGSNVEILDSTIAGNVADSAGGGMIGPGLGYLSISRSQIADNSAGDIGGTNEGGGGILCFSCALEVVASSITGNVAGASGGGIALLYNDYVNIPATIINSTVSGNSGEEGAGILIDGGSAAFSNSTVAFNVGTYRGAGISATSYTVTIDLQSTIVAGNTTSGAANNVWTFPKVTVGANNLVPNAAGLPTQLPADTLTTEPLLLPLANNGGPTPTHALADGSPAIDAGNNAIGIIFDQRGPDFLREFGSAADIGAFERQPPPDRIHADGFDGKD